MPVKTEACMLDSDTNLASGEAQSCGFDDVMAAASENLLGGKTEAMDVEEATSESTAKSSRSEAAPVEVVMGTKSRSNPKVKSDCSEEPPVQDTDSAAAEQPAAQLTPEEALARLVRIAIGGNGPPEVSGNAIHGLKATHQVIKVVCVVSHSLFEQRKKELRWVTETAQLDRYEGIAYVLAEVLGAGEMLLEEARPIGKRALERIEGKAGVKARVEKLKQQAKSARSKATAKAKKDVSLTDTLLDTITQIDKARDEKIEALMQEVYTGLGLPDANTEVRTSRARTASEQVKVERTKIQVAREKAATAAAAATEAEKAAAIAASEAERAEKSHTRLGPCPTPQFLNGFERPRVRGADGKLVHQTLPDDERELRVLLFEQWVATQELAGELRLAALEAQRAARALRADAEDADDVVTELEDEERRNKSKAALQAAVDAAAAIEAARVAQEAEWAAEDAAAAEARARVREDAAAWRRAALEVRRQDIIDEFGYDPCSLHLETPAETRARITADARREWGYSGVAYSPPRV